jgi:hypothetical protein
VVGRLSEVVSYWNQAQASAQIPTEGPKACPLAMTFPGGPFTFDQLLTRRGGFLSLIATLVIDNSENSGQVEVVIGISGQIVKLAAGDQASLPVLCPQNATLTFSSAGSGSVGFDLVNTPLPAAVWTA